MNFEKSLLFSSDNYFCCLQFLSTNAIDNGTHWLIVKDKEARTLYKCADPKCPCKSEIIKELIDGDTIYYVNQIGIHQNHQSVSPKPLKEHVINAVTSALAASNDSKYIRQAVAEEVQMQINPQTINRIKRKILINSAWEPLWKKLPSYVNVMNEEQTLSHLWTNESGHIIGVFLTFPYVRNFCSSDAFLNMIFLDGTFCTDHNRTTLLAAVTVTSDKIILPLGVATTSGETNINYEYFLGQLSNYIKDSRNLTFLADRHPAIISSVSKVYPFSTLVPCAWHVCKHLHCPRVVLFELLKSDNSKIYDIRKLAFEKNYPNSAEKIKDIIDSMSIIKNNKSKFGYIADSPIESFNSAIKEFRDKEPLLILNGIFQWAYAQRQKQLEMLRGHIQCLTTEKKIALRDHEDLFLSVRKQLDDSYIVYELIKEKIEICYTVRQHLNCLRCDCNGYDREGIPCRHEYAVAKKFGLKNKLRKIASFNISEVIRNALGNEYECPNIGNLDETNIELPTRNNQPGRPKTIRYHDPQEHLIKLNQRKCSICGKYGHNKRTCRYDSSASLNQKIYENEESNPQDMVEMPLIHQRNRRKPVPRTTMVLRKRSPRT